MFLYSLMIFDFILGDGLMLLDILRKRAEKKKRVMMVLVSGL